MAIAAIDFGFKRMGVAVTDAAGIGVHPLITIFRTSLRADLTRLRDAFLERGIRRLVIGLPLNMDGTDSPLARAARAFAERIKRELDLEIEMIDERLTSFEARDRLKLAELTGTQRRKQIDANAAAIILESYLAASKEKSSAEK